MKNNNNIIARKKFILITDIEQISIFVFFIKREVEFVKF